MLHFFVDQTASAIYLWEIPHLINNLLMKSEWKFFCAHPFESSTSYKQPSVPEPVT